MDLITANALITGAYDQLLSRKERGNATRRSLILATIHLGARLGFSNVPLRCIVEVSKSRNISAIHYHFKGKEGLLREAARAINAAWPTAIAPEATVDVRTILAHFLLNLEKLKQADSWAPDVIPFLARLCLDDAEPAQQAAAELLTPRLGEIHKAIKPHCPDIPKVLLRLRVSNACLLLLTISANLNECYLAALGCSSANRDRAEHLAQAVELAASIVCSEPPPLEGPTACILVTQASTQVAAPST